MSESVSLSILAAVIACLIGIIGLWIKTTDRAVKLSDRISKVEGVAETALQEAAEAKNGYNNLREWLEEMVREMEVKIERIRREDGDALSAIRQQITDLAMFVRDHFVRIPEFGAAITEIKASQIRMEVSLDRIRSEIHSE